MSTRTFVIVLAVLALLVGIAMVFHTPGGQSVLRAVHGR